jgi:hypothetical protein
VQLAAGRLAVKDWFAGHLDGVLPSSASLRASWDVAQLTVAEPPRSRLNLGKGRVPSLTTWGGLRSITLPEILTAEDVATLKSMWHESLREVLK